MIVVVATKEEERLARERFKNNLIIKTGVGGLNVIRTLKHIPKWQKILNFGYAGSNCIPVGKEVKVGKCKLYHPNVKYRERAYYLNGDTTCFTSTDFVTETKVKKPCLYDMELAFICAMGFKEVEAIKIVSDNLSLKQYEEEIKNDRES